MLNRLAPILTAFVFTLMAVSAGASLSDAKIAVGPFHGQSLKSVVSKSVSPRAVDEAFAFYDRYEGSRRSAVMYTLGRLPGTKALGYQCFQGRPDCETKVVSQTLFENKSYLVIFDLNESSMKPRLHIVNIQTGEVSSLFAAHGKESGCAKDLTRACRFISDRDSEASPLGFFLTGDLFFGERGWTIEMSGLQAAAPGVSRNDVPTTIVIHAADYATPEFRRKRGFTGRSYGCPAMSPDDVDTWKDRLKGGALFYFFHNSLPKNFAPVSALEKDSV